MPDFFANPLGFLGLLAVPAILFIHLLREKSRRIRVSTLFLLERLPPRTPRGRTIHFLQNSRALWLQLLIALLCTWLLVQPHWLRRDSTQRVTLILDNSASMSAFRTRILDELPRILGVAARAAVRTEWVVLTSDQPDTPLFHGTELRGVLASLDSWQPLLPSHDPAPGFFARPARLPRWRHHPFHHGSRDLSSTWDHGGSLRPPHRELRICGGENVAGSRRRALGSLDQKCRGNAADRAIGGWRRMERKVRRKRCYLPPLRS